MLQKTIKASKGFLCYKCNYGNDFILLWGSHAYIMDAAAPLEYYTKS